MSNEPFFRLDGDRFVPTEFASGSWTAGTLHGRTVVGVMGFELERQHGDADFQPSRLTVDMYRMPPAKPFEIRTRMLRDGRRVRLAEAELFVDGVSCTRAVLQFLRKGEPSPRPVWGRGPWTSAGPEEIAPPSAENTTRWDFRPVGEFAALAPRGAWTREVRELIGGLPHTPFSRVAAAIDVMSAVAHSNGEGSLDYINADVTLYLHRSLAGEWVGLESADQGSTAGVAVGACFVHDESGPIGFAACSAVHLVHPPHQGG